MAIYQADLVAHTDDLHQDTLERAQELSTNPMGKLLLGKIGWIYAEQAKQELGGSDSVGAHIDEFKGGMKQKANIAGAFWKTYKSAKKLHNEQIAEEQAEMKKAMEESKNQAAPKDEETKK